jgi:hypothetical protein
VQMDGAVQPGQAVLGQKAGKELDHEFLDASSRPLADNVPIRARRNRPIPPA